MKRSLIILSSSAMAIGGLAVAWTQASGHRPRPRRPLVPAIAQQIAPVAQWTIVGDGKGGLTRVPYVDQHAAPFDPFSVMVMPALEDDALALAAKDVLHTVRPHSGAREDTFSVLSQEHPLEFRGWHLVIMKVEGTADAWDATVQAYPQVRERNSGRPAAIHSPASVELYRYRKGKLTLRHSSPSSDPALGLGYGVM